MGDPKKRKRLALIGTILAVVLGVFFLSVPLLAGPLSMLVPASVEDRVGGEMIDELAKTTQFCRSDAGLAALDGVVDKIAATTDGTYTFKVYVANDEVLNAFAAPGGHIVIYRSIIAEAESPDEVAGVVAHEMAHITEGHPARGMVQALGYGVFGLLTGGEDGVGARLVKTAITSTYSRDDELDADRSGVEMLNAAGLDSHGLNSFFDTLDAKGQEIPGALEFLSTHPTGDNRKEQLKDLVKDGTPAMTNAEWAALQQVCQQTGDPKPVGTG